MLHLYRHANQLLILSLTLLTLPLALSLTDPSDLSVLRGLRDGLSDASKLSDWTGNDPCGTPGWSYIECSGSHVTQLQLKGAGLHGTLPPNLNTMANLEQIALQGNFFTGPLPSFNGLSKLTSAFLGNQQFTSIPSDFFTGLSSLTIISLENNPLNATHGWSLPESLTTCTSLTSLFLTNTTLSGTIPEFLGNITTLQDLRLAYNQLNGPLPQSFSELVQLTRLELNNQVAPSLSGPIDVVAAMPSIKTLWLQVNSFTGTIPPALGSAVSLSDCRLNDNKLVGQIPTTFTTSVSITMLSVQNNMLMGSIPAIPSILSPSNYTYSGNYFCVQKIGAECNAEVNALLDLMDKVNYPLSLLNSWTGNNPCSSWQGIACDPQGKNVLTINLPRSQLNGTISPALGNLTSLTKVVLSGNNLTGTIPESLTKLQSLVLLDVSNNDIYGPVPAFNTSQVKLILTGNVNINKELPPSTDSPSSSTGVGSEESSEGSEGGRKSSFPAGAVAGAILGISAILLVGSILGFFMYKKRRLGSMRVQSPNSVYVRPADGDDGPDVVKITVTPNNATETQSVSSNSHHNNENVQVIEAGNLVISIQLLKNVTDNFSEANVLGRGGFGVVYKGELDDGTKIAVKRMISSDICNKGLDEFHSEIAVLTKVRHRNLVALLGYCIEGNERLLVYEYMPMGALSQHLFEWKKHFVPPLSWEKRLSIALDMARGIEYLHGLAHKSFIHRDLKPSNVLLGDDYRAKVSDFGLVRLAPEGKSCLETRLAGTFGYLAPEYAVTGRVTTKSDVFSFGVMLMELLTGRKALDETQPDESMHLVTWFRRLINNKAEIFKAIDPVIDVNDETSQSIVTIAELAWHCTAREPQNRPDMSHAVNVLSPIVEEWKPNDANEDEEGIDLDMTLPQALKKWQAYEGSQSSDYMDDNTRASMMSMPACPSDLVHTFTSIDGR